MPNRSLSIPINKAGFLHSCKLAKFETDENKQTRNNYQLSIIRLFTYRETDMTDLCTTVYFSSKFSSNFFFFSNFWGITFLKMSALLTHLVVQNNVEVYF